MTTTIDNALHKLLENVEEMKLPEGDYLTLTNLLKKVFDEKDKKVGAVTEERPTQPIRLKMMKCMMKHIEIELEVTSFVKTQASGGYTRLTLKFEVRTRNTKTDTVVTRQDEARLFLYGEPGDRTFGDKLRAVILRYYPHVVEFTMDGFTTEYTLKDLKDHESAENRVIFDDDDEMDYSYKSLFGYCFVSHVTTLLSGGRGE